MNNAILGMGVTGQSIARYLRASGEQCTCFDETFNEDMTADVQVAPFDDAVLSTFDRVVISPGVIWNHPALVALRAHAEKSGAPALISDLDLFIDHYQGDIMAVTGTNGKTTVTHLLGVLLETVPGGVEVGGNIGQPMLDVLSEARLTPRVVLELSSFQLERSRPVHPHWAALLNVQPDHVDMHASPEVYREAKERLFFHQGEGDCAVLPIEKSFDDLSDTLAARGVVVRRFGDGGDVGICGDAIIWQGADGNSCTVPLSDLKIRGRHQQCNLAVAAQGAADCGVHNSVIIEGVTSFRGLPHRLQWIGNHHGHDWFNDSKATNPDAAGAALTALGEAIWICGGVTKGVDLLPLHQLVHDHARLMVVIGSDPSPFVALAKQAATAWEVAENLEQAVALASHTEHHLPVVLAPAAASFDQFTNYVARGDAFVQAVGALTDV